LEAGRFRGPVFLEKGGGFRKNVQAPFSQPLRAI
jgi:hypothetical protein